MVDEALEVEMGAVLHESHVGVDEGDMGEVEVADHKAQEARFDVEGVEGDELGDGVVLVELETVDGNMAGEDVGADVVDGELASDEFLAVAVDVGGGYGGEKGCDEEDESDDGAENDKGYFQWFFHFCEGIWFMCLFYSSCAADGLIGLVDYLELLLGVAFYLFAHGLDAVGVVFHGEATVGFLDLLVGGCAVDAKYLVWVFFIV